MSDNATEDGRSESVDGQERFGSKILSSDLLTRQDQTHDADAAVPKCCTLRYDQGALGMNSGASTLRVEVAAVATLKRRDFVSDGRWRADVGFEHHCGDRSYDTSARETTCGTCGSRGISGATNVDRASCCHSSRAGPRRSSTQTGRPAAFDGRPAFVFFGGGIAVLCTGKIGAVFREHQEAMAAAGRLAVDDDETEAERYDRFFGDGPTVSEEPPPDEVEEEEEDEEPPLAVECARDLATAAVAKIVSEELRAGTNPLAVTAATTFCAGAGVFDEALTMPPPKDRELLFETVTEATITSKDGPGVADPMLLTRPWPDEPKEKQHRYVLTGDVIEQRPHDRSFTETDAHRAADSLISLVDLLRGMTPHLAPDAPPALIEAWVDDLDQDPPFAHLLGIHPLNDASSSSLPPLSSDVIHVRYFPV